MKLNTVKFLCHIENTNVVQDQEIIYTQVKQITNEETCIFTFSGAENRTLDEMLNEIPFITI